METRQAAKIPKGEEWTYEPKWDGFRCLAFRNGDDVELQSKSGETLTRYFPEIVAALKTAPEEQFVTDGELLIITGESADFDALLQRIHPAESRVRKLSRETPASYVIFDLLVENASTLYEQKLRARRERLESFIEQNFDGNQTIRISPATDDPELAQRWLEGSLARLDGVIAKRDVPYAVGSRDAVVKIKRSYTADCVVGGFRGSASGAVASLLLGLYDDEGLLHHVGFVGSMNAAERRRAAELLRPIVEAPGFTGAAPGGPSRWRRGEAAEWFPVRPEVVVEVAFDHVTAHRFRHGTRLLRWRPDKAPRQCTIAQVAQEAASTLALLDEASVSSARGR
ncbi:MAG: ATP-dependent DNA ligase [Candidatus Eremiobacteraeota bacterium]|nr:ATP-dependent DNA ligase [Candidatus Eremiobacteraeota bacterium]